MLSIFILLFSMMHCFLFFFFCNCSAFQQGSLRCGLMSEGENMAISVHSKSALITLVNHAIIPQRHTNWKLPYVCFYVKKMYNAKWWIGSQEVNTAKCHSMISWALAHGKLYIFPHSSVLTAKISFCTLMSWKQDSLREQKLTACKFFSH